MSPELFPAFRTFVCDRGGLIFLPRGRLRHHTYDAYGLAELPASWLQLSPASARSLRL